MNLIDHAMVRIGVSRVEKIKSVALFVRSHAPVLASLLLAVKTVLMLAGQKDAAHVVEMVMSVFSLGILDGDTSNAIVLGSGAIYKVVKNLSAQPAPGGGA